jgi:hypothetical protein
MLAAVVPCSFGRSDDHPDQCLYPDGSIMLPSCPSKSLGYAELLARSGWDSLEAEAKTKPNSLYNDRYSFQSFGAQFGEVRVLPDIGRIRVTCVVSVLYSRARSFWGLDRNIDSVTVISSLLS